MRVLRHENSGLIEQFFRAVEMPIRLFHAGPPKQRVQIGVDGRRFLVAPARFIDQALVFQVPCEIRVRERIALFRQLDHFPIVILADLRPVRLGHQNAHQIVRLRIVGGDADRIPCVMEGSEDRTPAEQQ